MHHHSKTQGAATVTHISLSPSRAFMIISSRILVWMLLFACATSVYADERPQRGRIVYEGTYSGREVVGFVLLNQGTDLEGAITISIDFDGPAARATIRTTGKLQSSVASGLVEGDQCKLFGRGNLAIEARCTASDFTGTLSSQTRSDRRTNVSFKLAKRPDSSSLNNKPSASSPQAVRSLPEENIEIGIGGFRIGMTLDQVRSLLITRDIKYVIRAQDPTTSDDNQIGFRVLDPKTKEEIDVAANFNKSDQMKLVSLEFSTPNDQFGEWLSIIPPGERRLRENQKEAVKIAVGCLSPRVAVSIWSNPRITRLLFDTNTETLKDCGAAPPSGSIPMIAFQLEKRTAQPSSARFGESPPVSPSTPSSTANSPEYSRVLGCSSLAVQFGRAYGDKELESSGEALVIGLVDIRRKLSITSEQGKQDVEQRTKRNREMSMSPEGNMKLLAELVECRDAGLLVGWGRPGQVVSPKGNSSLGVTASKPVDTTKIQTDFDLQYEAAEQLLARWVGYLPTEEIDGKNLFEVAGVDSVPMLEYIRRAGVEVNSIVWTKVWDALPSSIKNRRNFAFGFCTLSNPSCGPPNNQVEGVFHIDLNNKSSDFQRPTWDVWFTLPNVKASTQVGRACRVSKIGMLCMRDGPNNGGPFNRGKNPEMQYVASAFYSWNWKLNSENSMPDCGSDSHTVQGVARNLAKAREVSKGLSHLLLYYCESSPSRCSETKYVVARDSELALLQCVQTSIATPKALKEVAAARMNAIWNSVPVLSASSDLYDSAFVAGDSVKTQQPVASLPADQALSKLREGLRPDGHLAKHVVCRVYGKILFDRGVFRSDPSITADSIKVLDGSLYIYAHRWALGEGSSEKSSRELTREVITSLDRTFERMHVEMKDLSIEKLTLSAGLAGCSERNRELLASTR